MAGTLTLDTLKSSSGVLATQNGMTGIAKAWGQFTCPAGGTPTVVGSFNISSITRTNGGTYLVAFTTAMASSGYSAVASSANGSNNGATATACVFVSASTVGDVAPTTSNFYIQGRGLSNSGAAIDLDYCCFAVYGA